MGIRYISILVYTIFTWIKDIWQCLQSTNNIFLCFMPILKFSPLDYVNMQFWTLKKIEGISAVSSISRYFGWTENVICFDKIKMCVRWEISEFGRN